MIRALATAVVLLIGGCVEQPTDNPFANGSSTTSAQTEQPQGASCTEVAQCIDDHGLAFCRDRYPTTDNDTFETADHAIAYCRHDCDPQAPMWCASDDCLVELCD